jgi:hypothetical protein
MSMDNEPQGPKSYAELFQKTPNNATEWLDSAEALSAAADAVNLTNAIATRGMSRAMDGALKEREGRLQELRASLGVAQGLPIPKGLNADAIRWEALQQLSEWKGLLAQNVPIARQILRKVFEGRLAFVPRHEGDEHWYEFSGEGSLAKFFSGVGPLTQAMASPPGFEPGFQP